MANRIDSVELSRAISAWTSTINDASLPGVGSTVYGGYMKSQYTVNGVEKMYAQFQVVKRIEWNYSIARLMVMQGAGGPTPRRTATSTSCPTATCKFRVVCLWAVRL